MASTKPRSTRPARSRSSLRAGAVHRFARRSRFAYEFHLPATGARPGASDRRAKPALRAGGSHPDPAGRRPVDPRPRRSTARADRRAARAQRGVGFEHDAERALAAPALPRRGPARGRPGALLRAARRAAARRSKTSCAASTSTTGPTSRSSSTERPSTPSATPTGRATSTCTFSSRRRSRASTPRRAPTRPTWATSRTAGSVSFHMADHDARERRQAGARADDRSRALRGRGVPRLRRQVAHGGGRRGVPRERPVHPPRELRPLRTATRR